MDHRMVYGLIRWMQFVNWDFLFPDLCRFLYQVGKNPLHTTHKRNVAHLSNCDCMHETYTVSDQPNLSMKGTHKIPLLSKQHLEEEKWVLFRDADSERVSMPQSLVSVSSLVFFRCVIVLYFACFPGLINWYVHRECLIVLEAGILG